MTLEIDETSLAIKMDGMRKLAESNNSEFNEYPKKYRNYIDAYAAIGIYITFVKGNHVVKKTTDLG